MDHHMYNREEVSHYEGGLANHQVISGTVSFRDDNFLLKGPLAAPSILIFAYFSPSNHPNLLVKDLIEESKTGWNISLLQTLFNEADQQCTGSIPIFKFSKDDAWGVL
ncbi:hypothetical protein G4B88_015083 [Cannabis sativa]|uniref:Uncharacterized protein n=1 Tax=Cannabis sativa TaxID=3483 RepID=A0A7J6EJV8_CANSA|nr:hypothetical protein G4B88_015083 [Cannabis sativa]